jgi:cell wall-associated NlpC family hydrolase
VVHDGAYTYQDPGRVGFDCSGLTEYAAAQAAGVDIGTYTGSQLESPKLKVLDYTEPLKPGDLLYYGAGTAHHVAVYVAPGIIINAPESGLPVELGTRTTVLGPDPGEALIRGRRLGAVS